MSKGGETRTRILETGVRMASQTGFSGVSLAPLADACALSKSGLFAHFDSKESLQIAMLEFAAERFRDTVVTPTLRTRRGIARVRAAFDLSLDWADRAKLPGGCLFYAAAAELDDQPGPVRDRLVELQEQWFDSLRRIVATAVETGELSPRTDVAQFVSEFWGILLMHRVAARLLRDPRATQRARRSFTRLITASRVSKASAASASRRRIR